MYLVLFIISYLVGSIPIGWILIKVFKGVDLRTFGSGGTGATNAWRVNKPIGVITLIADVSKAYILVVYIVPAMVSESVLIYAMICGIICMIGNAFPFWLKFKGGKGIDTSLGFFLFLRPEMALIALVLFALILLISKFVSLSSILAAFSLILSYSFLSLISGDTLFSSQNWYLGVAAIFVFVFAVFTHRDNIKRILDGSEPKI